MSHTVKKSVVVATLSLLTLGISHAAGKDDLTLSGIKVDNAVLSVTASSTSTLSGLSASRWTPKPTPDPTPEPTPEPEPEIQVKAPPQGIFHSAGFISSNEQKSTIVSEAINGQDYIDGSLVRVGWKVVNPAEGEFDFSAISRELEQATNLDSTVSLAILDSMEIPQYVLDKCETFNYTFRGVEQVQTCLPWDAEYQKYKGELISQLGQQLDSHPNLAAIYFTYSAMTNGIEMHWRVDEDEFSLAGYTPERLSQAYNDIMDMYAAAFPTTNVIMEVHAVFEESYLAESAFEHCYDEMGSRCGVAIWWCSSRMATDPKQSEYKVYNIAQQASELSFAVCQTIGSFSTSPDRFDSGQSWTSEEALRNETDFFIGEGFKNFELWSADIKDSSLVEIIENEVQPKL